MWWLSLSSPVSQHQGNIPLHFRGKKADREFSGVPELPHRTCPHWDTQVSVASMVLPTGETWQQ